MATLLGSFTRIDLADGVCVAMTDDTTVRVAPSTTAPQRADLAADVARLERGIADLTRERDQYRGLALATAQERDQRTSELSVAQRRCAALTAEADACARDLADLRAAVIAAAERGRQVEAEAVDTVGLHPPAQAVHDPLQHARLAHVEAVAAAAEVVRHAMFAHRIPAVLTQAAPAERGAIEVALGGVVEHHIQNHLDFGLVQCLDHGFETVDSMAALFRSIGHFRGKKVDGGITPIVAQRRMGIGMQKGIVGFIKLVHRQQLHRRHPKLLQVGNLFNHPLKGAGVIHLGNRVHGKPPHMQLIDDAIQHGMAWGVIVFPVKIIFPKMGRQAQIGPPPILHARQTNGIGVNEGNF